MEPVGNLFNKAYVLVPIRINGEKIKLYTYIFWSRRDSSLNWTTMNLIGQ